MYYIEISPAVLWVLGGLLVALGALLVLVLYNLSELHYLMNMILTRANRRQSSLRDLTQADAHPTTRRY